VGRLPDAYEKLIHAVIQGESHNFVRADEVEEGWRIFDPLLQSLETPSAPHPFPYAQGTRGPPEADELINGTGY
ncbi:Glucose-6-phosphate 1-dehydrogenase 2 (G6PD), partial [Durusdinium trenchii]